MWAAGLLLVIGPVVLVFAGRESRIQRRLRAVGSRTLGEVTRYQRSADAESGSVSYFPVVSYRDEAGAVHECRSVRSASPQTWPIGRPVPVVYLPGQPKTARLDVRSQRVLAIGVMMFVGVAFIAVGVLMLGVHQ
jgi:hypothetical protein